MIDDRRYAAMNRLRRAATAFPPTPVRRAARRTGQAARRELLTVLGGPARARVVLVLAAVLALSSADTATVGASAVQLRGALHIGNTDIGVLVAVTSVVGAVFSLPFGVLADRVRRTWMLGLAIVAWGAAMIWSATAGSFGQLLVARLCLGAVTAAAGPAVASLIGDWIPAAERGKIYGYLLTGELAGAGVGFAVTGDIAALSWRAAFIILALPAFGLAWLVFRLPEPARGGADVLAPEPHGPPPAGQGDGPAGEAASGSAGGPAGGPASGPASSSGSGTSGRPAESQLDAQQLARDRGVRPDPRLAGRATPGMGLAAAVRYVLSVRTNVVLIISGACGYYFLAGVETFGSEFAQHQYGVGQVLANFLLLVVGAGAVAGVLAGGRAGDALLRRGHLSGRVLVAAVAATATTAAFIPALLTHSILAALPYVTLAALALSAQNPPIDAARLDIMPSWLWGRAEGIRTFLRTAAQALAPVLFGVVSDHVFGGGPGGLRSTFAVMLVPLAAAAALLYLAARRYPADVAAAAAATDDAEKRRAVPTPRQGDAPR